jgi:hypothetical protein
MSFVKMVRLLAMKRGIQFHPRAAALSRLRHDLVQQNSSQPAATIFFIDN